MKNSLCKVIILSGTLTAVGCGECYTDKGEECKSSSTPKVIKVDRVAVNFICTPNLNAFSRTIDTNDNWYTEIKKYHYWYKSDVLEFACINGKRYRIEGVDSGIKAEEIESSQKDK